MHSWKGVIGLAVAAMPCALRCSVASDGLLSNLSLVMGVAGANPTGHAVLIAGLAGLLAGSFSMALGEWISVQSSRELYERQIAIERDELAQAPQEEEQELALIYQAKGLPENQARDLARRLVADPATALDTLAREELGIDPARARRIGMAGGTDVVFPVRHWCGDSRRAVSVPNRLGVDQCEPGPECARAVWQSVRRLRC